LKEKRRKKNEGGRGLYRLGRGWVRVCTDI
jgi:hypothetical protein